MYEYVTTHNIETDLVYLPVYWTNLQNHPGFQPERYNTLLQHAIKRMPPNTRYVTVVQHDDGPLLDLPPNTIVFGACTGSIPLPLIYEDRSDRLIRVSPRSKTRLASFIGSATHPIRREMVHALSDRSDVLIQIKEGWSPNVGEQDAQTFIEETRCSKFCLAPRGYGRSSFRFFEAMLLNTVPVYMWDDKEWLPYKEHLDYTAFSVSISKKEIGRTYEILSSITEEEYEKMKEEMARVRHWFTLDGMAEYIVQKIKHYKVEQ